MIYVVLGMHKSGTSLVAELLHRSGINMAEDDLDLSYETGEKYERSSVKRVNEQILGSAGTVSYNIRPHCSSSALFYAEMQRVIHECNESHVDWGFKDPRSCFTYRQWEGFLPPHRIVAVYRQLPGVLSHYHAYQHLGRMRPVARAWTEHNQAIMAILEQTDMPHILLSYERLMEDDREMARLREFVGHALVDARAPALYQRSQESMKMRRVRDLMTVGHQPEKLLAYLNWFRKQTAAAGMTQ